MSLRYCLPWVPMDDLLTDYSRNLFLGGSVKSLGLFSAEALNGNKGGGRGHKALQLVFSSFGKTNADCHHGGGGHRSNRHFPNEQTSSLVRAGGRRTPVRGSVSFTIGTRPRSTAKHWKRHRRKCLARRLSSFRFLFSVITCTFAHHKTRSSPNRRCDSMVREEGQSEANIMHAT